MARKLKSFVDGFCRYTEGRGSPLLFRKWTAIFLIAAAMERKGWMLNAKGRLFPNMYIFLVGPAGVGKSLCTGLGYTLLNEIRNAENQIFIAPTSVTKASLVDFLSDSARKVVNVNNVPPVVSFNSLQIVANELGVFLPAWDGDFMSTLTDLWDNGRYAETRRTSKISIDMPDTQLNLLSATTPAYMNALLPEGAWEFGFMSRVINIYSGEAEYTDIFAELEGDEQLYKDLIHDIIDVYKGWGQFAIEDDVKVAINAWAKQGGPPSPDHPKLVHYQTRRLAHLLKLCMIASASTDNDRVITLDHYAEALDWLIEAERYMPDIFKSLKVGGDARAIEELWHFAYINYMKHKEPVPEHLLVAFLQERVPAHSIDKILDIMTKSKLLTKQFVAGGHGYVPKTRSA